jgi:SAM-dependent methyltransferase
MRQNRQKAFNEISRVLKKDGIFIFTTHDRNSDKEHSYYWEEESRLWARGRQNSRILDYGDLIYKSYDREMFIHIPDREEILTHLRKSGLRVIEDKYRPEICQESEKVKEFSDECRFWVVKKDC